MDKSNVMTSTILVILFLIVTGILLGLVFGHVDGLYENCEYIVGLYIEYIESSPEFFKVCLDLKENNQFKINMIIILFVIDVSLSIMLIRSRQDGKGFDKRNGGRGNNVFCKICDQKILKNESCTGIEDSKDIHYGEMRHKQCEDNLQKIEKYAKHNENFKKIIQAFDTKFEAVIEIKYDESHQSKLRYFFGHEDNEITRSKDFIVNIDSNYLYICITPTAHEFIASWSNPKGNFNVGDNFDSGYTGIITFKSEDKELRSVIIKIFRNNGFGCLPGSRTIHAHKNDETPNIQEAEKILHKIIDDIKNYVSKSSAGDSLNSTTF